MLHALGAPPEQECYRALVDAYTEPHRAYHTAQHISDCLALLNECASLAVRPSECECALWFHDAVYDPMSKHNEERSADWAGRFLAGAGVATEAIARIQQHVLATRHAEAPSDADSQLVVDIDLAILGASRSRYQEFEKQVRREFRWVPGPLYRRGRAEILRSFLDRATIYSHPEIRERFEAAARENLSSALLQLIRR